MNPGDLIEWYFTYDEKSVLTTDELWSSTMKRWVPIGEVSLLLYKNATAYGWLNRKGYFHAHVDDTSTIARRITRVEVFPRARD